MIDRGRQRGRILRSTRRAAIGLALLLVLAGCHGIGVRPDEKGPATTAEQIPADGGEFVVPENMLDTWNTIGKILVGLDGVEYEGRAQMLGLYSVRYQGERFLVRTRALVLDDRARDIRTRVDALGPEGDVTRTRATAALLQILARRVPAEVALYRQPVRLRPDPPVKKKPARKRR